MTAPNTFSWPVQAAKNRLSEVIDLALHEGPQTITRHGRPVVVVAAVGATSANTRQGDDFAQYLLNAPRVDGLLPAPRRSRKTRLSLGG